MYSIYFLSADFLLKNVSVLFFMECSILKQQINRKKGEKVQTKHIQFNIKKKN